MVILFLFTECSQSFCEYPVNKKYITYKRLKSLTIKYVHIKDTSYYRDGI